MPASFEAVRRGLADAQVAFVPASGRQLATLQRMFPGADGYIAENGAVVNDGNDTEVLARIDSTTWHDLVTHIRAMSGDAALGAVVCCAETAYCESTNPTFLAESRLYYANLEIVEDLSSVTDEVVKVALYASDDASKRVSELGEVPPTYDVVVSGAHWVDVMARTVSKGAALKTLADHFDVPLEATMAFGDYLNDASLLREAGFAVAMANAHPDLFSLADLVAPPNTDEGVVTVLRELLDSYAAASRPLATGRDAGTDETTR